MSDTDFTLERLVDEHIERVAAVMRRMAPEYPRCPLCGALVFNGHHCENGHLQERRQ